jgi:radical SAM protein with 4Fe4S-binding SPASM domain
MVDFAKARKVTLSYVNYIAPRRVGCGADSACDPLDARLSPKDIIQYEREVHEYNIKSKLEEAKAYGYTDEEYENKRAENIEKNRLAAEAEDGVFDPADSDAGSNKEEKFKRKGAFSCAGGLTAFWITFDGKMTPCGLVDVLYSKPLEVGFLEAARQLREACEETSTCQECKTCELRRLCMVCPARVYLETGSFDKCPDYLKESARERRDLRLKGLW